MALDLKQTEFSPGFTTEQVKTLRRLLQEVYNQVFTDIPNTISLGDLADVVLTSPQNKDVIRYDTGTTDWLNEDLPYAFVIPASNQLGTFGALNRAAVFRMPFAFTVTEVRASVETAQTSGNILTVDINKNGTTILSTKITIDNNEKTSESAVTPPVVSVSSFADDDEVSIDIDQIGNSTAVGLVVTIIGRPT